MYFLKGLSTMQCALMGLYDDTGRALVTPSSADVQADWSSAPVWPSATIVYQGAHNIHLPVDCDEQS
jgi:hypothetical protein